LFVTQLGLLDWTILVVYASATMGVGFWAARGQKNIGDYLLGSRQMPWWAVLFSIVATESSIISFLSVPGLVTYIPPNPELHIAGNPESGNWTFLQLPLGYIVGRYLVVFLLLPAYFEGRLFTAYEVLGQRFGGSTKRMASLLFVVTRTLADGVRLYLAAFALQKAFHVPLATTIALVGGATLVYTYVGGLKAVVWTEVAQFAVKIFGTAAVGWAVVQACGGFAPIYDYAVQNDSLRIFRFDFDFKLRYTFWSGLIGGAFPSLASHGVDQMMVQRYLSSGSLRAASRALAWSGWVILVLFACLLGVGTSLACYFHLNPPTPPFTKNDDVFVAFLLNPSLMPAGVVGLMLAAILSAAMSTLSSSLNASAGTVVTDWLIPWFGWSKESDKALRVTKLLTIVFGLLQIGVAFGSQDVGSAVDKVLDIAGYTTGVVLGLYFLGVFTRVREPAALFALLAIIAITLPLKLWFPTLMAGLWYAPLCSLGMLPLGLAAEWVLQKRRTETTR
jgi:solute:Na+ symporter, SSS family